MKKRLIKWLTLSLALLSFILPSFAGAVAAGSVEISAANASGLPGGTVSVAITLNSGTTLLSGGQAVIQYDGTKLAIQSITAGDAVSSFQSTGNINYGTNEAYIGIYSSSSYAVSGTLATISFKILDSAAAGSTAAVTVIDATNVDGTVFYDANLAAQTNVITNGTVTVDSNNTVTYNANGGSGNVPTDSATYETGKDVPVKGNVGATPLTLANEVFAGWTSDSAGTGTIYKAGDNYPTTGIFANINFYAKWVPLAKLATVQSVAVSDDTAHTGASASTAKTGSVSVSGSSVSASDIVASDTNATVTFYGTDSTYKTPATSAVTLSTGSGTTLYITVASQYSLNTYYYAISATTASTATDLSFTSASAFWMTTISYNSSTYNLIRYGNNTFVSADTFVSDMTIPSGCYVEVYDLSGNLIRSTQSGTSKTTSSSIVSTGVTVKLYDSASNLKKTYGLVLKGDINGDGNILGTDATIVKRIVAGTYSSNNAYTQAASDINGDGTVLGTDATLLKRRVANTYTITQTT